MIALRIFLPVFFVGLHLQAEEAALPIHKAERYATMTGKSPFALATSQPAPAAPQASFAANWYVGGIARMGDTDFVTIKSRDATLQLSLFGQETDSSTGVSVASVNWSETVGKSTVVLRKGTEMAKLEFNEADLRNPPASQNPAKPGVDGRVSNGAPPPPGSAPVPGSTPRFARPPFFPGRAPSAPVVVTPPQAGRPTPPGSGTPGEIRRRVRTIPAPVPQ